MKLERNKVYHMRCEELMRLMPDKFVDCSLTSPPYNVAAEDGKYQEYEDAMTQDEYFEWQVYVINELLRVTKRHVFYNIQMVSGNKSALLRLMGHFHKQIKEVMIWDKMTGTPAYNQGTLNSTFEFWIIFSNSEPEKRMFKECEWRGIIDNIIRNPKNSGNKHADVNAALMPLNLARKMLRIFCKKGDFIYDPYGGLFTTAKASIVEGMDFIASERAKSCFDVGSDELNKFIHEYKKN